MDQAGRSWCFTVGVATAAVAFVLALALVFNTIPRQPRTGTSGVTEIAQSFENISYMPGKDPQFLALDVHLPEAADGPLPTLLLLHGTGWGDHYYGNKAIFDAMATYFSERGYATVSPNWLLGTFPPDRSMFSNAFCALAWIHSNAGTYGFDPGRIAA